MLQHTPDPSAKEKAQPLVSRKVIPDEDPQRSVDMSDNQPEDDYSGLMDDGVGDDFMDDDGNDEDELHHPDRFALPPWLSTAFKARLEEANNRGHDDLPKLYSVQQTFWFPQKSSFFLLKKASIGPQDLYNPRFFLWDPECLVHGGIGCLCCGTKLYCHGFAAQPR